MGKQSDGWEAANFRSNVEQKGPRSSYADEIGKSGEGRGGERTEVRGTEKVKKKEKAASKRPPSSIHPLSVSWLGFESKGGSTLWVPRVREFFPRALFPALLFTPKPPLLCASYRQKVQGMRVHAKIEVSRGWEGTIRRIPTMSRTVRVAIRERINYSVPP